MQLNVSGHEVEMSARELAAIVALSVVVGAAVTAFFIRICRRR